MRSIWGMAFFGMATLALPSVASAKDADPCKPDLICASNPQTIVAALQAEGYKAKLDVDSGGDPDIVSAASGYNFDIFFYGCVEHKQCDSLQFQIVFAKDPGNTLALVNKWNLGHRFGQMALKDSGQIVMNYDLSTIGGLNKTNFADALDWWTTILGDANQFFAKELPPAKS